MKSLVATWATIWGTPGLEDRLTISFSTRMTRSLGRCQPDRAVVRLASWLREDRRELLHEVLCHEAAHAAVVELHGRGARPHGTEGKELMRAAGFDPRVRIPTPEIPVSVRARGNLRRKRHRPILRRLRLFS